MQARQAAAPARLSRRPHHHHHRRQRLISILDNGLNVQQAADAPRFHHQYLPDVLRVEKAFPLDTVDPAPRRRLHRHPRRGSQPQQHRHLGRQRIIYIDPRTGTLTAGHDHRHSFGKAAGY